MKRLALALSLVLSFLAGASQAQQLGNWLASQGLHQTCWSPANYGSAGKVFGVFAPSAALASPAAPAAQMSASLEARYGKGASSYGGTCYGEASVDPSPLFTKLGWPLPPTVEDIMDAQMVYNAPATITAAIGGNPAQPVCPVCPTCAKCATCPVCPAPPAPVCVPADVLADAQAALGRLMFPTAVKANLRLVTIPWLVAHACPGN